MGWKGRQENEREANGSKLVPKDPLPLGIHFELPTDAFRSLIQGHESEGQGDPWSAYYREPWFQIWRPDSSGWFCYALRFEARSSGTFGVSESWVGREIRSSTSGLGQDLDVHRNTVVRLLTALSGYDPAAFSHELLHGRYAATGVSFSGQVRDLADADRVAEVLEMWCVA